MSRVCGLRKSKKNPNAMTKDEIVAEIVSRGILNKSKAQKTSMVALCFLLGLTPEPVIPAGVKKECGPLKSKNHPYVYTAEELRDLIIPRRDEFGLTVTQIKKMSKNELCNRLFSDSNLPVKNAVIPDEFSGNCDEYTLTQLKHLAKKSNLSSTGTKAKICDRLEEMFRPHPVEEDKKIEDDTCMIPLNPDITTREHQKHVVRHLLKHRGLLAIHPTGTGKTLTAVAAMNCILGHYPDVKVIFIAPLSLIENFEKEMIKFGLDITDPKIRDRVKLFSKEEFYSHYKNANNANHCDKTFLIIDEAHNLRAEINLTRKKKTGAVAAVIVKCAAKAFKVLLLSATPMKNRPSDMINLITIVDGIPYTEAPTVKYFNNYILQDENAFEQYFKCKISMNVAVKGDDYPKRVDKPFGSGSATNFVMTPKYYNDYYDVQEAQAKKYLIDMYGDPSKFKLFYSAIRRASLSLDGEDSPKVQWTFNKLKSEVEVGNKSIIYSAWKESGLNYVRKLLDKDKIPYGLITGDMSAANRKFYKTEYNKGKIKILLLSKAGGEGLDLVGTRNVILMESNWNAADDEQIIGRAIRYRSHVHLPLSERYVNIWRLFAVKPLRLKKNDKQPQSIDEILYHMSYTKKDPEIQEMLARLEPFSIENVDCECYVAGGGSKCSLHRPKPLVITEEEEDAPIDEDLEYDTNDEKYKEQAKKWKRLRKTGYIPPPEGTSLVAPARLISRDKDEPIVQYKIPKRFKPVSIHTFQAKSRSRSRSKSRSKSVSRSRSKRSYSSDSDDDDDIPLNQLINK